MKEWMLALMLTCLFACNSSQNKQHDENAFVHVEHGQFTVAGSPYYYVGTNFWYGAILGSQGTGGNRARLLKELDEMQSVGINNLRILVGADGDNGIPSKVEPTLQMKPGVYNDSILDGLDFLLSEMGKRKMYAVLYLNNSWEWSGGYSVYLQWAGKGKAPVPAVDGWPAYMAFVKQFVNCKEAQNLFANHVKYIVSRTNRYTKKKYIEDSAIMSWQIGNEPRAFAPENIDSFAVWMRSVSSLIKSMDKNHLVSTGSEGFHGCEDNWSLTERIHADPNVDYINFHVWPYNWGWTNKNCLSDSLETAKQHTHDYIQAHLEIAKKLNKPMVMEEFGYPRDGFQFSRESSTEARDAYYKFVFGEIEKNRSQNGLFAGCNFWAWGGLAIPVKEHVFWKKGDDYTGDPAQEEQGLNSVFNTDKTLDIIKNANQILNQIVK